MNLGYFETTKTNTSSTCLENILVAGVAVFG